MKRREFLSSTAAMGLSMAVLNITEVEGKGGKEAGARAEVSKSVNRLIAPEKGKISVAFLISRGVTVIDFAGPWEVFQDVHVPSRGNDMESQMPFELFTVSEKVETVIGSAGLKLIPDYTFETAPLPKVVVVPAQGGGSPAMFEWLRKVSEKTDVLMSVCTGAFVLAKAGLLSGRSATTHHDFIDALIKRHPDIDVKRGLRFVEGDRISTAGGLTSGIDLALRVVERYFGREVAQATATYMEYQGKGWIR
jgi:transcriptional regulator GlxA family with amidase domain